MALGMLAVARNTLEVCDEWLVNPRAPRIYKRLRDACEAIKQAMRGGRSSDPVLVRVFAAVYAAEKAAVAAEGFRSPVSSTEVSVVRDYVSAARRKLRAAENAFSSEALAAPRRAPVTGSAQAALAGLPMDARLAALLEPSSGAVEDIGAPPKHPPELIEDQVTGWVRLLRFVPRVVGRLGISAMVRDGSYADWWLGSGAYAAAFSLPDPMYVLKLTSDPEDAYVAMKLAEAGTALPGLIRVYAVFRIPLPYRIETRIGGGVDTLYGMITERVLTLEDREEGYTAPPLLGRAEAALGVDAEAAEQLLQGAFLDLSDFLFNVNDDESVEDVLAGRAENDVNAPQVEKDFRFGAAWCRANGVQFGADAHHGNFAVAWRGDRFACVKSDLGHNSVAQGRDYAVARAAHLPLAANRRKRQD